MLNSTRDRIGAATGVAFGTILFIGTGWRPPASPRSPPT